MLIFSIFSNPRPLMVYPYLFSILLPYQATIKASFYFLKVIFYVAKATQNIVL